MGLISPLGVGLQPSWEALLSGQSGIGPITRFDASRLDTRIAGEVKDFNPADFMPKKDASRVQLFIAYAVAASRMALEDSGFTIDAGNAERVGVWTGCGLGGLDILEKTVMVLEKKGPKRVTPFFIPMMISNMAPGMISIYTGAKGPNASVATACAAGNHAIGEAFKILARGDADAMIAGGVESVMTPTAVAGFNAMKALSTRNDDPQKASRPFDSDRDGFVIGEGGGILILETLTSAQQRGAKIYAEIVGFGMSGDAFHMTSPPDNGEGMAQCMRMALDDAGMSPDQIDYINAHGTSTQLNDQCETRAIHDVFKTHAASVPISSTKSQTGHLLGGAGGVETIFSTMAIHDGVIPATMNLENPSPECDLDYVPLVSRKQKITTALTNSFGFGGTNACLILRAV